MPRTTFEWNPHCCGCDAVEEKADVTAKPKWCKYMPEATHGENCEEGSETCECQFWCAVTPSKSQGWNPKCCGCEAAKWSKQSKDGGDDLNATKSTLERPAWCRWVPNAANLEMCQRGGDKGCECKSWCWAMPRKSQQWNPKCCGCEEDGALGGTVTGVKPKWCQYMPPSTYGKFCKGDRGEVCQCRGWCHSTPQASRPWNPECCGCPAEAEGDSDDGKDAKSVDGMPAWCKWVPDSAKRESCKSGACTCDDDLCTHTPENSDKWNAKCCGCSFPGRFMDKKPQEISFGSRPVVGILGLVMSSALAAIAIV